MPHAPKRNFRYCSFFVVVQLFTMFGRPLLADETAPASPKDNATPDESTAQPTVIDTVSRESIVPEAAPSPHEADPAPAPATHQPSRALPMPTQAPSTPPLKPVAGYDEGFFIQSPKGDYKLKIQGRVKARYTFESTDEGDEVDREQSTSFSVPFARLYLSGHLFDKRLAYVFQPEFGGGNVRLMMAYADAALIPEKLYLTFGLFKRPFSREFIAAAINRSFIADPKGQMGQGTDIGLQLSNNYAKTDGLEWAVGVFNSADAAKPTFSSKVVTADDGTQRVENGKFSNDVSKFKPALVWRLGYNNGVSGYSTSDLEGGPVRFGIAMSNHIDFDVDDDETGALYLEGDFILKAFGFSLSSAVYTAWADNGNIWNDPAYAGIGGFGQTGYFFGGHFEPVLRYGISNPKGANDLEQEVTAGFTFYFYKQRFKLENNVSAFLEQDGSLVHVRYASQLQWLF